MQALASLVPEADPRKEVLKQAEAIVGAGGPPTAAERDRLTQLSGFLAVRIEKPAAPVKSGRTPGAGTTVHPPTVSH